MSDLKNFEPLLSLQEYFRRKKYEEKIRFIFVEEYKSTYEYRRKVNASKARGRAVENGK